jgi:hypothetical protein
MYTHVPRRRWHPILLLLLLPLVGTLVPKFSNRNAPSIGRYAVLLLVPVEPAERGMHLDRLWRYAEGAMVAPSFNALEFGIVVAIFAVATVLGLLAVR